MLLSPSVAGVGVLLRRRPGIVAVAWAGSFLLVLTLLLAFAVRDRPRRLPPVALNGSFETGLAPWRVYGAGRAERAPVAKAGRVSAKVTAGDVAFYGLYTARTTFRPAGGRYRLTAWLKPSDRAVGSRALVQVNEPAHRVLAAARVLSRGWTRVQGEGVSVGNGITPFDVYVYVQRRSRGAQSVYIDAVSLRSVALRATRTR